MLSCLTLLSCPRCGPVNLKDRKITQHASYLILHGSKYIVPCTKRHICKEAQSWIDALRTLSIHLSTTTTIFKVQFIDGRMTLLFSSATRTFHTTANATSCMYDSGLKLSHFFEHLHYFHTGLVYFHQNTKQFFEEFPKTKDAISLKQHKWFFLECIILIIIDDINVKVIDRNCNVLPL